MSLRLLRQSRGSRHLLVAAAHFFLAVGCNRLPDQVQSDFDFSTHAFTFANFGTESHPSEMNADLAIRMFGRDAVCLPNKEACQVRDEAQMWLDEVNQTLAYGHSEGMAVAALLMATGQVNPSEFGASNAAELRPTNPKLGAELAYWAATQKLPQAHLTDVGFAAKDVMPFLAQTLKRGAVPGWRLLVAIRDGDRFKGGHALVPFGYFKGERGGLYYLRVYDSNMPQAEQRLTIDVEANTWNYEGSFDTQLTRSYEGNPENGNLLWFSAVASRLGTFPAPFAAGASLTVAASHASVVVESPQGVVGFQDGELKQEGGRLIPAAADCLCKLPNEIVNIQLADTSAQKVTIQGQGFADTGTVNITGNGVSVKVDNIDTSPGAAADTVSVDGKSITYTSGGENNVNMTTSVVQDNGSTTSVVVTVGGVSKAVRVDASDPNNVKVDLDNLPAGTPVQVTVTTVNPDGTSATTTATATTNGNDAQIALNPSTNTSTVDTNINFETCRNGKKDAEESDLDCGNACKLKPALERLGTGECDDGKACKADNDCLVGEQSFCFQGFCKKPSCDDGLRNGDESDVDCGTATCGLCGLGQRCLGPEQCDPSSGATCLAQVCVTRSTKVMRFNGLPPRKSVQISAVFDNTDRGLSFSNPSMDGGTFEWPFKADFYLFLDKPTVNFAPDVSCAWNGGNAQGQFIWRAQNNPPLSTVELDCRRLSGTLSYNATGACPAQVDGRALYGVGTVLNYSVFSAQGAESETRLGELRGAGTIDTLYAQPDGGISYRVLGVQPPFEPMRSYLPSGGIAEQYRQSCTLTDAGDGTLPALTGDAKLQLACDCQRLFADGGTPMDGGTDAGADAGSDGGFDAGSGGYGAACMSDNDCTSSDCYCALNSGNCSGNSGHCGAGRVAFTAPTTDGVASSGTWTVPPACTSVQIRGWGAAGGSGLSMGTFPNSGGSGGFISGTLSATAGDVFTAWVGNGGDTPDGPLTSGGVGSFVGTPANGGAGDGMQMQDNGGRGGGLSSLSQTGSAARAFSVPAGSGGGSVNPGVEGGGANAGDASTRNGGAAGMGSTSGGGGAGENGGLGGAFMGDTASPGAYGTLPSGITAAAPGAGAASNTGSNDYSKCGSQAGLGQPGAGGPGCFVLRCVYP